MKEEIEAEDKKRVITDTRVFQGDLGKISDSI